MTDVVRVAAIAVSAALLVVVIDLVRRGRLREEYALVWLAGAIGLLALSVWRRALDVAATWLGVYYPPAVLLLAVILAVFLTSLSFAVVISTQRRHIDRLVQDVALLDAEVRALQSRTVASAKMIDRAAADRDQAADQRHVG